MESNSIHTLDSCWNSPTSSSSSSSQRRNLCKQCFVQNMSEPPLVWHWTRLGNVFELDDDDDDKTDWRASLLRPNNIHLIICLRSWCQQAKRAWLWLTNERDIQSAEETWQMHRMTWKESSPNTTDDLLLLLATRATTTTTCQDQCHGRTTKTAGCRLDLRRGCGKVPWMRNI